MIKLLLATFVAVVAIAPVATAGQMIERRLLNLENTVQNLPVVGANQTLTVGTSQINRVKKEIKEKKRGSGVEHTDSWRERY